MEKIKKYHILPTIKVLEGLMLLGEVLRKGLVYAKIPKISDEDYIKMVKMAVAGE